MRRAFIIIPIFLLFCGTQSWAKPSDYSDFKINDLDWLDLKDAALFLNGNSYFNGTTNQQQTLPGFGAITYNSTDQGAGSLSLSPDFKYNYETRLRKWNWDIPFNFAQGYDYTHDQVNTKPPNSQWKPTSDFSSSPQVSYTYFFDIPHVGFGLSPNITEGKSTLTGKNIYGGNAYLSLGLGRIREGKYAYQAMQIIEDLALTGQLLRPVSADDMQTLSRIIAEERNRLVLDSRQATLEAMGRIFSFLTSQSYLAPANYQGLLIAEDDYRYVYGTSRPFGEQLDLQAGMYYSRNRSRTDYSNTFTEYDSESHYTYLNLVYNHSQPLSLTWQYNFNAALDCEIDRSGNDQTFGKTTTAFYSGYTYEGNADEFNTVRTELEQPLVILPTVSWSWCYIPNTRWEISLTERVFGQGWREVQGRQTRLEIINWATYENSDTKTNWIYALGNQLQLNGSYELNYFLKASFACHWNYSANFARDSNPMTDQLIMNSDWGVQFSLQYQIY